MSDDIHEIYAIKYGRHDRPKADNYIGGTDPHDVREPIDYYVWAITGPSGTFVVDTGFDAAMAKKRGRTISKPIAEGLKAIDVPPESVKNVIISHLHYDHCGNYDTFPNARFHLQDTEMAYATGRCMCHAHLRLPFEEEDVVAMVRKVFAGRVTFHDGVSHVAPGITVHRIGGLASDTTHLYSHIENGKVFPITYNVGEVLDGYETMQKLAGSLSRIVPGHDPLVLQRYPAARSGLEGWVARLDIEPKA
jgi:glyoxylase-like metal-dependent hydrolase (beta-lactamase superfamily II)